MAIQSPADAGTTRAEQDSWYAMLEGHTNPYMAESAVFFSRIHVLPIDICNCTIGANLSTMKLLLSWIIEPPHNSAFTSFPPVAGPSRILAIP